MLLFFSFCTQESAFSLFEDLAWQLDFELAIRVWKNFHQYTSHVPLTPPYPGKPHDFRPRTKKDPREGSKIEESVTDAGVGDSVGRTSNGDTSSGEVCVNSSALERDQEVPRFRVTCHRTGDAHKFTSMEAARAFGGAINDRLEWKVDLSHADIDVQFNIAGPDVQVCICGSHFISHASHNLSLSALFVFCHL